MVALGDLSSIEVQAVQYIPQVECEAAYYPPNLDACRYLLSEIPASDDSLMFGDHSDLGLDVKLPISYADGKSAILYTISARKAFSFLIKILWKVPTSARFKSL